MELKDLEIYRISRGLSGECWSIYNRMEWQDKKIIGNQFITAVDSVGANIAEGFGRFHYLDRNKFNYNSRGSLLESVHWLELLFERGKISNEEFNFISEKLKLLHLKLNNYITITKKQVLIK
uniref:Four helix bundle protein n=1 Tax=candidate division CPR3 bacterium TaxID=2268181 RepID=A0A7C4R8V5_UNCC3